METRLALAADAPELAALHGVSFTEARWNETQIADSLKLPTTYGFIAPATGSAQGFILCQLSGDEMEILTFCTAPEARRQGIGTALLEAACAKKPKTLFLEVAADNQAARALYEKAGFTITGKRGNYYRRGDATVDALMYTLK